MSREEENSSRSFQYQINSLTFYSNFNLRTVVIISEIWIVGSIFGTGRGQRSISFCLYVSECRFYHHFDTDIIDDLCHFKGTNVTTTTKKI